MENLMICIFTLFKGNNYQGHSFFFIYIYMYMKLPLYILFVAYSSISYKIDISSLNWLFHFIN